MRLGQDLVVAFDRQIAMEFQSSLLYRQLAIEMRLRELSGAAAWLRGQSEEEIAHANRFIDHVADRDSHPRIGTVTMPEIEVGSMLECFQTALAHEEKVSAAIRDLTRAAEAAGDIDSRPLLDWFVTEQIEEEATVREIVGRITVVGQDGSGLLRIDTELAGRIPAAPAV